MDETPQTAARALAALYHRIEHQCPVCGVKWIGRITGRYCSNRCRSTARRQRKRPVEEGNK